jgi:hypothetical protein
MIALKGDRVRVESGDTGEVIELWGRARTFMSLKRDSDGKSIPMLASDVAEVLTRNQVGQERRGRFWHG